MKRLFAAIQIVPDERFLSIYSELKYQLRNEKIRWVELSNMHITLKFFGETPIEKIGLINEVFKKIASNHKQLELQLKKTGIFGSRYKPRVIWFGIGKNEYLNSLVQALLTDLEEVGFSCDRQNFVPHLSLGRMKGVKNKVAFQQAIDSVRDVLVQELKVRSFTLFESKLRPKGVVYNAIEVYKLLE